MILRPLFIIVLTAILESIIAANARLRERQELTISECAAKGGECDENRGRPVCGTDDQTYPTRCHLLRAQCSGHQVGVKYRGPCKACREAREYAIKNKERNRTKFIPRCKSDGSYATVQCLGTSGCWCSDSTGSPIENTSVRIGRPKCRRQIKANKRRSPARQLSSSQGRRNCNQIDRAGFNGNLLKIFQSEYIRSGQQLRDMKSGVEGAGGANGGVFVSPSEELVLNWKFGNLDTNTNQVLDKNEFRELKKLVKGAVKPRRCARTFGKFCDVDNDERLSSNEWRSCLAKDGINRAHHNQQQQPSTSSRPSIYPNSQHINLNSGQHHSNISPNNNNNNNNNKNINNDNVIQMSHNSNSNNNNNKHVFHHNPLEDIGSESGADDDESSQHLNGDYDEDTDYDPEEGGDDDTPSMQNIFGSSSTLLPSIYILRPNPESPLKESEGESDCLADRAAALEEQKHGGTGIYVPDCTPDGRYQRVQCYRSTPYCWCVNEDTGKNIPGTSVKYQRPQCNLIYPVSRPMKGCPEPRKTAFLKDLKDYLKSNILQNTNSPNVNQTNWYSEDEKIATLSFFVLDKNKNKSWERKEWKTFRELMKKSKTLKKCGKKMPRYCDVNGDKKITLTEWLNCLQAPRFVLEIAKATTPISDESGTNKPLKLSGSNPLEQYLKED